MKLLSWNVNGYRSSLRHGLLNTIDDLDYDILCLQEIRLDADHLDHLPLPDGYHSYLNPAITKGYAGTALFTKVKPTHILTNVLSEPVSKEGRTILAEFPTYSIVNIYAPHGGRDKSRMAAKAKFYKELKKFVEAYPKPLILAGDFNIAHQEIDLARPKTNHNNTMFTSEERAHIAGIIDLGYKDTLRALHPHSTDLYSWWPYAYQARERNVGWRIDYIFTPQSPSVVIQEAGMLTEVLGSDHCPVYISW